MRQVHNEVNPQGIFDDSSLIYMLGEELKKPLATIKVLAERDNNSSIQQEARRAMRTIDNILYYQQISAHQQQLQFTTVHAGSSLAQVSYSLKPLSIERGCETNISIQRGIATIHADPIALQHGLESLWQAILGMTTKPSALNWQIYRLDKKIRIVVTNDSLKLDKVKLSSKSIAGRSRQPYVGLAGPATDLVAAQSIFSLLGSKLSKVKKDGQCGLAVSLPISSQMTLV